MSETSFEQNGYHIERSNEVAIEEIMELRSVSGSDPRTPELWQDSLERALCFVVARNTEGKLIGAGRITGDKVHAQLVDLDVDPEYRKQGIGGEIVNQLVSYAREERIQYFGLTYSLKSEWLKGFYERHGFQEIGFAMWHEDSIDRLQPKGDSV